MIKSSDKIFHCLCPCFVARVSYFVFQVTVGVGVDRGHIIESSSHCSCGKLSKITSTWALKHTTLARNVHLVEILSQLVRPQGFKFHPPPPPPQKKKKKEKPKTHPTPKWLEH